MAMILLLISILLSINCVASDLPPNLYRIPPGGEYRTLSASAPGGRATVTALGKGLPAGGLGKVFKTLCVNIGGFIGFIEESSTCSSQQSNGVYGWFTGSGQLKGVRVHYNKFYANDSSAKWLIGSVNSAIQKQLHKFQLAWLFIATWESFPTIACIDFNCSKSFQIALATNGNMSVALFLIDHPRPYESVTDHLKQTPESFFQNVFSKKDKLNGFATQKTKQRYWNVENDRLLSFVLPLQNMTATILENNENDCQIATTYPSDNEASAIDFRLQLCSLTTSLCCNSTRLIPLTSKSSIDLHSDISDRLNRSCVEQVFKKQHGGRSIYLEAHDGSKSLNLTIPERCFGESTITSTATTTSTTSTTTPPTTSTATTTPTTTMTTAATTSSTEPPPPDPRWFWAMLMSGLTFSLFVVAMFCGLAIWFFKRASKIKQQRRNRQESISGLPEPSIRSRLESVSGLPEPSIRSRLESMSGLPMPSNRCRLQSMSGLPVPSIPPPRYAESDETESFILTPMSPKSQQFFNDDHSMEIMSRPPSYGNVSQMQPTVNAPYAPPPLPRRPSCNAATAAYGVA